MIKLKLFTAFLLFFNAVNAEPLHVGINTLLQSTLPAKVLEIETALNNSGLDFEFHYLPPRRSLKKLLKQKLALAAYRTPSVMLEHSNVIQIEPAVDVQHFWLVASNPKLCLNSSTEMKKHTVAGIRGVQLFQDIYQDFNNHLETGTFAAIASMLHNKRVDYSLWPLAQIKYIKAKNQLDIFVCGDKPYKSYAFHSYIHKNYAWAIPQIEQAYKSAFNKTN